MSGFMNYFWREKVEIEKKVEIEETPIMSIKEMHCSKSCLESVMNTAKKLSKGPNDNQKLLAIDKFVETNVTSACHPVIHTHPISEVCESPTGAVSKSLTSDSGSKRSRKRRFEEVYSDDEEYETPPSSQTTSSPEKRAIREAASMTRESREYSVPGGVIVECTPEHDIPEDLVGTEPKEYCYIPETQLPGLTYTINN